MSCIPVNEGNKQCQHCKFFYNAYGCMPTYNDDYCPCGREAKGGFIMENTALDIVKKYIEEHLDKSDPESVFEVFAVWKCKVLQNWKFLISSTLPDGMYYELTYNGDKKEWYLDAYKKFENRCIKIPEEF